MVYNITMFLRILFEVEEINLLGSPFSRGCPGVTYIIDNYGNETQKASLSTEDQKYFK